MFGSTHSLGVETFGKVVRVDWQARECGWLADDLVITSKVGDLERSASVSVKSGQSVTVNGFPYEFVETAWNQALQIGTNRVFRDTNDVIVFATGNGSPAAEEPWSSLLRQALATTPDRMAARLTDNAVEGQQSSKEQRAIFASFSRRDTHSAGSSSTEEIASLAEPQAKERVLMIAELGATDWGVIARAIHVLAVVVWIGSVWLVTMVLLPGMKNKAPADWVREFDAIEHRFAPQARIAVLLVLLSGLYMLYQYDLWNRFTEVRYWWMDLMVAVWLLFALMLFAIEPFVFRHVVHKRAEQAPEATLALMLWLHRALLTLSLIAIFAAVGGSQGLF
jgi:uncharacterized membrane protein